MPPIPFQQLSDEPLYCEAVHNHDDTDFYSGSEDDHYEGPLHRRLHIEKKAIDFLSGNVPILLSATLRGPFDRKLWNNPWRSTRAESHAEPPKAQPTRSRQTVCPDDNLPDTQGTSLYPLPSPEITNPPSARKNPYMGEQDYSRVKAWREAVKSTSVSKDPFWQSQQSDNHDKPRTRKRSADSAWLHKRDGKKRRSVNPRNSTPDDSPSRSAARTKGNQARQISASQVVKQPSRVPSLREDELATNGCTGLSVLNASQMANRSMGSFGLLRPGQTSPRKTRRYQCGDTSEDELSMPATTPTSNVKRYSTMISTSPTGSRSPSRRGKATKSNSRSVRDRENLSLGRGKVEKPQLSRSPASQHLGPGGSIADAQRAAQMAEAALKCMDESPQESFTMQSEPLGNGLDPNGAVVAKPLAFPQVVGALPSTQQDNSFCFHKRARSPAEKAEFVSTEADLMDGAIPSPSSLQLPVATTEEQGRHSAVDDGLAAASVRSDPAALVRNSSQNVEGPPNETEKESGDPISALAAVGVYPSGNDPADHQAHSTDWTKTNGGTKNANESPAKVEPAAADESADSVQLRSTDKHDALEDPRAILQIDGCAQSDSEWSTYLDSQDPTPTSAWEKKNTENANDIPVMEYGVDGLSDPDWSTFVDTQDIMPVISSPKASVKREEVIANVVHQGSDIHVNSDEIIPVNVQNLPSSPPKESTATHDFAGAAYDASSPVHAGSAGNNCQLPTPAKVSHDADHSQASVGSIIDAYAEISVMSTNLHLDTEITTTETSTTEMLEAERREIGADAPSLSKQIATVSVDESDVPNESTASVKLQQLQATLQMPTAPESQLSPTCDPGRPDEIMVDVEIRDIEDVSGNDSQIPRAPGNAADYSVGASFFDETTISTELPQFQSPWAKEEGTLLQTPPQAPNNDIISSIDSNVPEEAAMQVQSPWSKKAAIATHLFVPQAICASTTGSTPNLSLLAGKAVAVSQPAKSPWGERTPSVSNLPTPNFEMSIRAFSDFMTPSPIKKRVSSNGSILTCSSTRSGILFKTSEPQKPARRVHFAPLPGKEEAFITEPETDDTDGIYDEEDISYFDPSGQKTGTVRLPKPTTRVASPPPTEMSSVEAGVLPDHDQKFAKHFEAMSKRKKPTRKSLRLLPSESQQGTSPRQEVGAMAEAFIQASQTRRKGLELAVEKKAEAEREYGHVEKAFTPVAMEVFEDQENVEPVDDVSAVLDNLDDFLDNTWGIDMGVNDRPADEAHSNQEKKPASIQSAQQEVGDPMLSLEANVWAD